jgi:hypothetical protein
MNIIKGKSGGIWSFFWFTLVFGLILAFIGLNIGIAFTLRLPATNISLSGGVSLGKKEVVTEVLPSYLRDRIADNKNFINQTHTVTIWVAEGIGICIVGEQPEAPNIDLAFNFKR